MFWKAILFLLFLIGCATSPLGRSQLMLVPESQMDQMGAQAFSQLKSGTPIERNLTVNDYVRCVAEAITQTANSQTHISNWEIVVFKSNEVNAFALPGGKIGVYTGLLKVAKSPSQLAAVLGHEVGHVIAHHGAERVSQQAGTQLGLEALGALTPENPNKNALMGLLGVGVQVGVLLPFSRTQESEADIIGLNLMAQSGFDPTQSVELWKNMIAASGGKSPPQILSTHPASENRIKDLEQHMPEALPYYQNAVASGRRPNCKRAE